MTAVVDKYVYGYMEKNGCRIGGEQSGHIIFSKYASAGDGILTSLKMMEVMLAKKMPMSKLSICPVWKSPKRRLRTLSRYIGLNRESKQLFPVKVRVSVDEIGVEPDCVKVSLKK